MEVALVDLSPGGATQTDIQKTLDGAVMAYVKAHHKHAEASAAEILARHRPLGYATGYELSMLPEIGLLTGFSDATTVRVPFGWVESDLSGVILVHLSMKKGQPRAEPGKITETKDAPDPVHDDPRLAAADKELNAAYTALRSKLDTAGKAKLVAEQREWLQQRDHSVAELSANYANEEPVNSPRIASDRLLLQLTKERTAALLAR
jgi:uncharacterized protein YecT (DUF1311 family)